MEAERSETERREVERLTATGGGWRVDAKRLGTMEPVVPVPKQLYLKKGNQIKSFVDGEWKRVEVTSKGGRFCP